MTKTRNSDALASFTEYCQAHPNERFWQALRNWSGWPFILVATALDYGAGPFKPPEFKGIIDTFGWEGLPQRVPTKKQEPEIHTAWGSNTWAEGNPEDK